MRATRSGVRLAPVLCVSVVLAVVAAAGQEAAKEPEKAAGEQQKRKRAEEPVQIKSADRVEIEKYDDPDARILVLKGNVHLRQEEVELFADTVRMDQGKETAEATGNLRVVDPENVIVGDVLTADFNEGRITLTGNVRLVHEEAQKKEGEPEAQANSGPNATASPTPEKQAGEPATPKQQAEKKRTVLTCDRLHYYYDEKRAICIGTVVAKQDEDTVYTHRAIYDEEGDILTVAGDVRLERTDGSVFRFRGAVIDLDDDTIQAEGMTNSILIREKKEKPEAKPASEAPKPAAETGAAAPPAAPSP